MRSSTCANRMRLKGNRILRQIALPVVTASLILTGMQSTYAYTAVDGTVTCTSGKVRKEASTSASFAFGVRQDETVKITDEVKGTDGKTWYQIKVGDSTGYIRSDLVQKSATATTKDGTKTTATTDNKKSTTDEAISGKVIVDVAVVREAASTKAEIVMCLKQDAEVTVKNSLKGDDDKKWYSVVVDKGDVSYKGYVRADLLKANGDVDDVTETSTTNNETADEAKTESSESENKSSGSIQVGKIKGTGVNVRESAVDGNVICHVTSGQSVTVTEQMAGSDGNVWYKISFTNNLTPQTGYIRSDFVEGVTQTVVADSNTESGNSISDSTEEKEEPKEEEKEYEKRTGAVNGANVNVRKEPGNGEIVTWLSTGSTVTVINEKQDDRGRVWYEISYKFNKDDYTGWMLSDFVSTEENKSDYTDAVSGLVKGSGIRVRESAVNGTVVEQLNTGHRLNILGETQGSDGEKWYYVEFTYKGSEKKGYISSAYVNVVSTVQNSQPCSDADFESAISCLPDSYKASLRNLHEKYPNWQFEVVNTGLDWNEVLSAECSVGKNLVSIKSISSWKSTEPQAYNWTNDTWYGFDGGTWASASKELIAYYMDPRNFLSESGIFQFEKLDCLDYQNEDGVQNIITGTFMDSSFVDTDGAERNYKNTITDAAREAGISPYHLATRIVQEQGLYGKSQSIAGNVPGYENLFNYFNIGAYAANGNSPTINGLIYASGSDEDYARPWNSRYRSILGSAKYVSEKYVKKGQNTLYFEKFNVVNSDNGICSHQYMSNIQAASSESARMRKAYSDMNVNIVFRIPYYNNMPESPCEKPTGESNPNNYLTDLYVEGQTLSPGFSAICDTYYLTVDNSVTSINIGATAVAGTSSIGGAGTVELNEGTNTFTVVCKAQNGNTRNYTLVVQRN